MAKKIIAVLGATGAQGGGLVRAITGDAGGEFGARAITRDPRSESARELEKMGAELVAGDVDDPVSLDAAFAGAYGAYCVTFFWGHFSPEREKAQARAMAGAARRAGVDHVIWSTLEDTRKWVPLDDPRIPTLMDAYKVPHFDAKGESDRYFTEAGVPTTFLLTSFYWENLIQFGMGPKRDANAKLVFGLPMGDKKLPGIAASDIGACAYGIFKRGGELVGKRVGIAGEHLTGAGMAAALARALDEEVAYQAIPLASYRELGFPGAEDLANMFQFKAEFESEFCAARSVEFSRTLHPGLMGFDRWLAANARRIPID